MPPELREFIETHKFEQSMILGVVERLPESDEALDELIASIVEEAHVIAFNAVVVAALESGRRVDARHLAEGAAMMMSGDYIGNLFWHMCGDKVAVMMQVLTRQVMPPELQLHALLAVAAWQRQHDLGPLPTEYYVKARELVRVKHSRKENEACAVGLAAYLGDADLMTLAREHQNPGLQYQKLQELALKMAEARIKVFEAPTIGLVPKVNHHIGTGTHLRRALPKIGRNEPCHCGSGAKYKRCCYDKDQERARFPSEVAGLTQAELRAEIEPHLTPEKVKYMPRPDIRRLRPEKIPLDVRPWYLISLAAHQLFDHFVRALECYAPIESDSELKKVWDNGLTIATMAGDWQAVAKIIPCRYPDGQVPEGLLKEDVELMRLVPDPAAYLEKLEKLAAAALRAGKAEEQEELGYTLLSVPHPALSVLLVQGLLPVISKPVAMGLHKNMQAQRDKLLLPAEDPFAEIIERRFAEAAAASQGKDAQKLRETNDRLQVKSGEVRELKDELEHLRRDLRLKEKAAQRDASESPNTRPVDPEAVRDLRQKVETLKSNLNDRTQERATLREELAAAYSELQQLKKQSAPAPAAKENAELSEEDALLQPAALEGNQPLRLLEYPKKFHETLSDLPRQVSRAAQILLGRLSGGEPSAFVGIVALRARPDTLRLRVGSDHRLLFRLHATTLEVVDLINRKDLDRRVKSL